MPATLLETPAWERRVAKYRHYGDTVRISEGAHHQIALLATWYGPSQKDVLDDLVADRLAAMLVRMAEEMPANPLAKARRPHATFEAVLAELFGLAVDPPADGDAGGAAESSGQSLRISASTHQSAAILARWYDRTFPHLYDSLLLDRLKAMYARMRKEMGGRAPRVGWAAAVREELGLDLGGDGDRPKPKTRRGR